MILVCGELFVVNCLLFVVFGPWYLVLGICHINPLLSAAVFCNFLKIPQCTSELLPWVNDGRMS